MTIDYVRGSLRESLMQTEMERLNRVNDAWLHYTGQSEDVISLGADGSNDNIRINLSRALVSKGVSWLLGADRALTFSIEDDESAEEKLEEAWPIERRSLALNHLAVNGGVVGHTFARLTADGRVVVWDPSNVTPLWDDEDIDHVYEYRNQWTVGFDTDGPSVRRQRVIEQESTWLIIDEESRTSGDSWQELRREVWPYDWAPVFHCQNMPMPNEFWGQADLEQDVLDLIDAIEVIAGYSKKIVRHKGHPLPYTTGEAAKNIEQIDVSVGQFLAIPNEQAKVGQLEATSLEGVLDLYAKLWEAFHYTTRTPPIAFGIINMSNVAEETVELAYSPAVEKTWDKRLTYGPMFTELTGRILELAGTADKRPVPQWGQIIPRSAGAEAAALEADRRMGIVSKETAAEQRGYDWEIEEERLAGEAEVAAETARRMFDAGTGGMPTPPPGNGGPPPRPVIANDA